MYYAVIFTSEQSEDLSGYHEMAVRMEGLARQQEGFLGIDSVREGKRGITVSYWSSLEAVGKWQANLEHRQAQQVGREKWYASYRVRIAKVEREYEC